MTELTAHQTKAYEKLDKAAHEARVAEHGFRDRAKKALRDARTATLKADILAAKKRRGR